MEKNHDMMKTSLLQDIRKSSKRILVFAIVFLICELISRPAEILYTYLMQKKAASGNSLSFTNYLNAIQFDSLPEQIIRAVMIIASIIALIVLLSRIRKSESPFQEKHGKILQIIAVLNAAIAFVHVIAQIVMRIVYGAFEPGGLLGYFSPRIFSYWLLANAAMLYFLAWVIRYGALLQQESDETL
jgi:hypothetical protein